MNTSNLDANLFNILEGSPPVITRQFKLRIKVVRVVFPLLKLEQILDKNKLFDDSWN